MKRREKDNGEFAMMKLQSAYKRPAARYLLTYSSVFHLGNRKLRQGTASTVYKYICTWIYIL